jgi:uncharacterized membrane protein
VPEKTTQLVNAAALGVVAGMRSQLPLALLCLAAHQRTGSTQSLPDPLRSPKVTALLLANAAGEIVVDKLPFTPSRLMPGSLAVRAGVGGLAGGLLAGSTGTAPILGAAAGALGALAGSYAGYHVRASLVAATGLPDPLLAIVEDVAAISIGSRAVGLTAQRSPDSLTR